MVRAIVSSILSLGGILVAAIQTSALSPSSSAHPSHAADYDLRQLMRTLKRIKAMLRDGEEREIADQSVKLWLKELKQVACAAEDVLDEYCYEFLRANVEARNDRLRHEKMQVCGIPPLSVPVPDGIVDRIQKIRRRFDEVAKDRDALRLTPEDGAMCRRGSGRHPPATSHLVDESVVFGRENEKREVIDLLMSELADGSKVSVVPIVGKGGLGKTTLAQIVYNDENVRQQFDLLGWVYVSEDFDIERLTQDIIESITGDSPMLTTLSPLQEELREQVRGKKVLLVLDDVWNEQRSSWETLCAPFMWSEKAIFIVTTRNDAVSQIMQKRRPFRLGYLRKEYCRLLFHHYAFSGIEANEQSSFVEIGEEILKKCGGLPLAVKSLASLLRHEADEDGWKQILQSDLWESHSMNEIFAALKISYARMPSRLKPCFLFCSMFPKNYTFQKDQLVRHWIAQGYVAPRSTHTLEDIGSEYVDELIERSFLDCHDILASTGQDRTTFKLHDVMNDLAQLISEKEHWSMEDMMLPIVPVEVYHLYARQFSVLLRTLTSGRLAALRTLALDLYNDEVIILADLAQAKGLRSFELIGGGSIVELPHSTCFLKHLRNLHLGNCSFEKLPEPICLLYNLQMFTLFNCSRLVELPEGIGNLISLQYLDIRYSIIQRLPQSFSLLSSLHTLILHAVDIQELPEGIGNLDNLLYLSVCLCEIKSLPESVCYLSRLKILSLYDCQWLEDLPAGIGGLQNLHELNLRGSGVLYAPVGIQELTTLQMLNASLKARQDNRFGAMSLLKNLVNLKGSLCIAGLARTDSLEEAKNADLSSEKYLSSLILSWWKSKFTKYEGFTLAVSEEDEEEDEENSNDDDHENDYDRDVSVEMDFPILEQLQPHPNLKELSILGYRGNTFPRWMGNSMCCSSLQSIYLSCPNLSSLSLHDLPLLRSLSLVQCNQLLFLRQDSLPLKLQSLCTQDCGELKVLDVLQGLESLLQLRIYECPKVQTLAIGSSASKVMTMHIENCKELESLKPVWKLSSLQELKIASCPVLHLRGDDLLPSVPSIVEVTDCPLLREWCQQQNIGYLELNDGGTDELSSLEMLSMELEGLAHPFL